MANSLAVDATGCLKVTRETTGDVCNSKTSLSVELTNNCVFPVRAQLCLRGPDHQWVSCGSGLRMLPYQVFVQSTCYSDGGYTYWGCSKFAGSEDACGGNGLVGRLNNKGR